MNEFPTFTAPSQSVDRNNEFDPRILNHQQQPTPGSRPVPNPGQFFQLNEDVPSTGKKRSKASISKSPLTTTTNAAAPSTTVPQKSPGGGPSPLPSSQPHASEKRQRRQRVLVDMHNEQNDAEGGEDAQNMIIENAYERERLERIKRNQEVMRQMGLRQLVVETAAVARPVSTDSAGGTQSSKPRRRAGPKKGKFSAQAGPRRSSARNRHQAGEYSEKTELSTLLEDGDPEALESLDAADFLLDLEDYFKINDIDASNAIKVDGHYSGWVSKEVAETYGLPLEHPGDDWIRSAGAAAAPSTAGGSGKRGRKKGGRGGGSDAKAKSSASLSYNPNAYFYRHVAPNQRQAQGEWTQEEHEKFMAVVREWGVGDNWGLFASHICQRVGYQCSAFYRDVIIPSGAVLDDRFKMTRSGKAVFVR